MTIAVPASVQAVLDEADASSAAIDERNFASKLNETVADDKALPNDERRGLFAIVGGLYYMRARRGAERVWDMYWQPVQTFKTQDGREVHSPALDLIDDEVIDDWGARSAALRHPVLRARYADLAWEIGRYRRKGAKVAGAPLGAVPRRPDIAWAHRAIDSYLDAVEHRLISDDFLTWMTLSRAIELAVSINDQDRKRLERAKRLLFEFRAGCESRDPTYPFWPFDDIAWDQRRTLGLTEDEKATIIAELERVLAIRSNMTDPKVFDPFIARDAADRLKRWREQAGQVDEARRAAKTAGAALERAAEGAQALTAIAWLSDQVQRYREIGDDDGATRVERTIRRRAPEMRGEMKRISVPLDIKPEELDEWADQVAGGSLQEGLAGFATIGLSRETRISASLRELTEQTPLMSHIPISVVGADGFEAARIGSVEKDIEGRTLNQAANRIGWFAPFLNVTMLRIRETHGLDLERFLGWLSESPVFAAERLSLVREGLRAWFAEDYVNAIHVLVPQVEAAIRELLIAIGGSVIRPDHSYAGFMVIGFGDVLHDARFRAKIPADLRFHLRVLYSDPRGINLRNEVAHGIAAPELFGRGIANWVVHTIVMLGLLRLR